MKIRINNRIGTWVDVPRLKDGSYDYHDFYLDKANRLICKNVLGKKWVIPPPYTIYRHFLGTNETSTKEILEKEEYPN